RPATARMAFLARLHEIVVADFESVPDGLKLVGHVVAISFCLLSEFGGPLRDFDGVFVVAHEQKNIVPVHAAIAGLDVGAELFKRGADMWPAIGIVDRGCNEERGTGHKEFRRTTIAVHIFHARVASMVFLRRHAKLATGSFGPYINPARRCALPNRG